MDYLLQVKLGCLFGLLFLTLFFGLVPSRIKWFHASSGREIHQMCLSFISCIAGGVFLGACLLDIVPDFLSDMKEAMEKEQITTSFPLPEFILGAGVLLVLIIERIVLECSHSMTEETAPLLSSPANSRSREENVHRHSYGGQNHDVEQAGHHFHVDFNAHSSFRSFILILSLSLHSIFEGIAIGLQNGQSEVLQIAIAILIHKSIIAISLSLLLMQSNVKTRWFVLSIVVFALMSPIGIAIGIGVMQNEANGSGLVQSTLEGLAAGTFVYITFLEILPHELNSNRWRLPKVIFILLGFSGMTALRFLG
ncbi:PREDICTED: zinc transporter ZIP1-like [Nanorana parkeri]|uniref:zinc transporter ZIP1-like n=1 Tax=Nanorana parkeri TaxID=125878 RepID=UPI0008544CAA|nr:PREDICTED: zinc transporter ZIP1-like [Nanorana parkeri]